MAVTASRVKLPVVAAAVSICRSKLCIGVLKMVQVRFFLLTFSIFLSKRGMKRRFGAIAPDLKKTGEELRAPKKM